MTILRTKGNVGTLYKVAQKRVVGMRLQISFIQYIATLYHGKYEITVKNVGKANIMSCDTNQ